MGPEPRRIAPEINLFYLLTLESSVFMGKMAAGSSEQLSSPSTEKPAGNLSNICIPETMTVIRGGKDTYNLGLMRSLSLELRERFNPTYMT